jgi:chemotaxis protein MotA
MKDFVNALKAFKIAIKTQNNKETETIKSIIELSNIARKEGLLALEEAANNLDDEYLKKGILLIVDGSDPELVRAIMETEMMCIDSRHKKVISFYETLAAMGPSWGMIGTLIGLINMLKNLSEIAKVGPNMSVALITTLYGSLIANWIATPIAGKLKYNNDKEIMLKEVTIEGLLSIQAGENPRVIEEKLKSFLSPEQRSIFTENEEAGGE